MFRRSLVMLGAATITLCACGAETDLQAKFQSTCASNFSMGEDFKDLPIDAKYEIETVCGCIYTKFDENLEHSDIKGVIEIFEKNSTPTDTTSSVASQILEKFGTAKADKINELAESCEF